MFKHVLSPPSIPANAAQRRFFKNGASVDPRGRVKGSIHRAGGYRIAEGCRRYPNFRPGQRRPWINAVCVFRPNPATDSDASRPPIPTERGH